MQEQLSLEAMEELKRAVQKYRQEIQEDKHFTVSFRGAVLSAMDDEMGRRISDAVKPVEDGFDTMDEIIERLIQKIDADIEKLEEIIRLTDEISSEV